MAVSGLSNKNKNPAEAGVLQVTDVKINMESYLPLIYVVLFFDGFFPALLDSTGEAGGGSPFVK